MGPAVRLWEKHIPENRQTVRGTDTESLGRLRGREELRTESGRVRRQALMAVAAALCPAL